MNDNHYQYEAEAYYRREKYQQEANQAALAKEAEADKINLRQAVGLGLISFGQKLIGETNVVPRRSQIL